MPPRLASRRVTVVLRAITAAALLAYLFHSLDTTRVLASLAQPDWTALAVALGAPVAGSTCSAWRWRSLLRGLGSERSFWRLMALLHVGFFFNNFLPTSVGGDVVRAHYASGKDLTRGASYGAVLVERLVGVVALAGVTAVIAATALLTGGSALPRELLWTVLAVATTGTTMGCLLFGSTGWRRMVGLEWRLGGRLMGVERALKTLQKREVWLPLFVASVALQVVVLVFYLACARAVHAAVPTLEVLTVVPVSIVAAMLPVTLNGLGVREGVFVGLLTATGADPDRAGATALLALVITTCFAVLGGLFYPLLPSSGSVARPSVTA